MVLSCFEMINCNTNNFQYKPSRVCIVIGSACNVKCRYCVRNAIKHFKDPKHLTDDTKAFLQQLDPQTVEAIVINGGEPLLYLDRIKEVFSLVPKSIHKAIMSNGTLMTDEIADWMNDVDCELHLSHEGTGAVQLKGVDILQDPKIVHALNRIHTMRLYNIITAVNCNILDNFEYVREKLADVRDFWFTCFPSIIYPGIDPIIYKDFDFDTFGRSIVELNLKYPNNTGINGHHKQSRQNNNAGFNLMPDGSIVSYVSLQKYGSMFESKQLAIQNLESSNEIDYCKKSNCIFRSNCRVAMQSASPFTCKVLRVYFSALNYAKHYQNN